MNYRALARPALINVIRTTLFRGNDAELKEMLLGMKQAGLTQNAVYECMLEVWDELNTADHDKELDRLANWLDVVRGHVTPESGKHDLRKTYPQSNARFREVQMTDQAKKRIFGLAISLSICCAAICLILRSDGARPKAAEYLERVGCKITYGVPPHVSSRVTHFFNIVLLAEVWS